ncbi:MAG: hypothetical protein D6815_03215 [Candidatus Dadabacteria bacterium]|nr:MAG: hypothetical protein D6815_03215 [Candidatus Dadabacteria bacterium]
MEPQAALEGAARVIVLDAEPLVGAKLPAAWSSYLERDLHRGFAEGMGQELALRIVEAEALESALEEMLLVVPTKAARFSLVRGGLLHCVSPICQRRVNRTQPELLQRAARLRTKQR